MDQATFERETALHREFWEANRDWIRREYAGKYVAIAQGRLIAVTATLEEATAAIQTLDPVPEYFLVTEADEDPIWEPYDSVSSEFLRDEKTAFLQARETLNSVAFEREKALNRQAYENLRQQIARDYAGQYVAIAHGRLLAVAPTFDEASQTVRRLQPCPEHFVVFAAGDEPPFEEVWDTYTELTTEVFPEYP